MTQIYVLRVEQRAAMALQMKWTNYSPELESPLV